MPPRQYILDQEGRPVPCRNLFQWAIWFGANSEARIVGKEVIGAAEVSTVFLGFDLRSAYLRGAAPPVLWETKVFGEAGEMSEETDRCSGNREQAEAMHAEMVARVKAMLAVGLVDSGNETSKEDQHD